MGETNSDTLWDRIRDEVAEQEAGEPMLASFLHAVILNHKTLEDALGFHLASKLESSTLPSLTLRDLISEAFANDISICDSVRADIRAVCDRDAACDQYSLPLLHFKGFHSIQAYRVAHYYWGEGRKSLALFMQSRISEVFGVDIHPAAKIGHGLLIDHATGVVIGETAVIENDVSMLHSVTLGGTGKEVGDRHPKVRHGVLIGVGARILGNIEIGEGAKVGAGSVVLEDVPPHCTVAGVPAKIVGHPKYDQPAFEMDHRIDRTEDEE